MLLQTNSYVVPREKRAEHARLLRRFRSTLAKLGCDQFEAFEQVGANWNGNEVTGRYVQIMRFRDRKHQLQVQQAERKSPAAQQVIAEFCRLIRSCIIASDCSPRMRVAWQASVRSATHLRA